MTDSILSTKLSLPPPRRQMVSRQLLIDKLNVGLNREDPQSSELTLISAPAGFGKTTLLAEWLRSLDRPVAWYSLDESDNDLSRFFSYLAVALQGIDESIGKKISNLLHPAQPAPVMNLISALLSGIPSTPLVLALDDFHVIEDRSVLEALRLLLTHKPSHLHMAIATRKDPPLPLPRYRAQGELTEIRARDLRFSFDEAASFLNDRIGLGLSKEDILTLGTRTEGWIVGLHLAAISLQTYDNATNRTNFIQSFAGEDRHVMDYLISEVLSHQSEDVQNFLLNTSILERLSGSLCDLVAYADESPGRSQRVLEYLESSNLFIIPLDNQRKWYRYHHLFADLLRVRLGINNPTRVPQLHLRASKWYESEGLIDDAIHHTLKGNNLEHAADLLDSIGIQLITESGLSTLLKWQSDIPKELLSDRPLLCISLAWANLLSGHLDTVEPCLYLAESKFANTDPDSQPDYHRILGHAITIRAFIARWQGKIHSSIELSQEALELLADESKLARAGLALNLGNSYLSLGNFTNARLYFKKAQAIGQMGGGYYPALTAITNLAVIEIMMGRLDRAVEFCDQTIDFGTSWGGGRPLPATGRAIDILGTIHLERNNLDQAQILFKQALEIAEMAGETFNKLQSTLGFTSLFLAQGDIQAASNSFKQAQEIHNTAERTQEAGEMSGYQALIFLAQGNQAAAKGWMKDRLHYIQDEFNIELISEYTALARLLIMFRDFDNASTFISRLLDQMEEMELKGELLKIQILFALLCQAKNQKEQALSTLQRALSIAEPEGYIRVFVNEGPPMAKLLYEAASRGITPEYIGKLISAFPKADSELEIKPQIEIHNGEIIVTLSKRELEVLQLISEGKSNQEIAQKLVLSLHTVKGHTRKIYSKLDVHSRTQAVAKAKSFGILSSD